MGLWKPFSDEKQTKRPRFVELRASKWFIMFVVSFATGTDIFMYGLIVPVTPTALTDRAGIPEKDVQSWTSILLALYSAALLAFAPVVGYIADRAESRRWPLLVGLVALAAATSLLCVGTHIALWIVGRLFQGAAAAVVWTAGLALMVDTLGKDDLGQAIGYVTMAISLGTLAGPLLGGVLYENGGYYAVFGLAFAFVAIDVVLRLVLIERRHATQWLTPETASPSVNGDQSTEKKSGETLGRPLSPTNASEPLESQPPSSRSPGAFRRVAILLSSPRLVVSVWAYFILSLVLTSFDSVLPLFVHETFGWQQSGQGLVFLPLMVPHIIDPLTGLIIDKYPKSCRYIATGAFLAAVPVMTLLRFVTHNSMQQKILLCALLACVGLLIAMAMPILVIEVFFAVKEKEDETPDIFGRGGAMALAFGLSNMGFATGSLIGPFFAGFIRQEAGWGTMGWALGLVTGISSVPLLLFVGGWILTKPEKSDNEVPGALGP
ncbi:Major facilitator superfamily domain, general substrate transporter [Penicillium griseofulvum]|uniref:Major facilitator superfamily domain, general substrate transporter n=1 Tax=Penicillium patulum TaxID=5078 RepID=A0A135LV78_PENPA|nr:Major facilitator superfamily domain, general substrate transporter [Penicillium griseofulvum]KXG52839.1 Major facilitator superfamily domain, general substrate transporter [Penicillium griseofulvum]